MAFTNPPKTWANGSLVTETDLNTHLRDQLRYLKGLDGDIALSDDLTVAGGVAATGAISGTNVTASGGLNVGTTGASTGQVKAANGTFSGAVSAASLTASGTSALNTTTISNSGSSVPLTVGISSTGNAFSGVDFTTGNGSPLSISLGAAGVGRVAQINQQNNAPLSFKTNNVERMQINGAGEVGIATAPVSGTALTVNGATAADSINVGTTGAGAGEIKADKGTFTGVVSAKALVVSANVAAAYGGSLTNSSSSNVAYAQFSLINDSGVGSGFYRNSSANTGYGGANSLNILNIGAHAMTLGTANTVRMTIDGSGYIGMGMAPNTSYTLAVAGAAGKTSGGTSWATISDRRAKDMRRTARWRRGLDAIRALRPVSFVYNGKFGTIAGEQLIGVIADEAELIIPEMVQAGPMQDGNQTLEDFRTVTTDALLYTLVNAVRELAEQNDALVARLAALEAAQGTADAHR